MFKVLSGATRMALALVAAAGSAAAQPSPSSLQGASARASQDPRHGDPQVVLRTWASALERHDFARAWEQFGQPPASRAAFARWWRRYRTIHVALGPGVGDAAMGSLYYTAPATLTGMTVTGKPFRLHGDVVVRRVNDVDGATPAQLRWHIGTADLKTVVPR
jgi:hypothetical protein